MSDLSQTITEAIARGIRPVAIADACQMSEATVLRWMTGQVTPHEIVARTAIEAIATLLSQTDSR